MEADRDSLDCRDSLILGEWEDDESGASIFLAPDIPLPSSSKSSSSSSSLHGTRKRDRQRAKKDFLLAEYPLDEPVDQELIQEFSYAELTSDDRPRRKSDRDVDEDDRTHAFPFDTLPREAKEAFWKSFRELAEQRVPIRSANAAIMDKIDDNREHERHRDVPIVDQEALSLARQGSMHCYKLFEEAQDFGEQFERIYFRLHTHHNLELLLGSRDGRRGYERLDDVAEEAHIGRCLARPVILDLDAGCWAIDARATILVVIVFNKARGAVVGHCYFPCPCLREAMENSTPSNV